jgi:hypothetical protein
LPSNGGGSRAGGEVHVREERVEIDRDPRQGRHRDDAAVVDLLLVAPVRSSPPDGEGPLVGVEPPDFLVATILVLSELGFDIIP